MNRLYSYTVGAYKHTYSKPTKLQNMPSNTWNYWITLHSWNAHWKQKSNKTTWLFKTLNEEKKTLHSFRHKLELYKQKNLGKSNCESEHNQDTVFWTKQAFNKTMHRQGWLTYGGILVMDGWHGEVGLTSNQDKEQNSNHPSRKCHKTRTSIYKTTSTMCSKTRGPAMSPVLVTCPIWINKNEAIQFKFMLRIDQDNNWQYLLKMNRWICDHV